MHFAAVSTDHLYIDNEYTTMGLIYNLSEAGAFIWEKIDGRRRLTDIKGMMIAEYDVGSAEAEKDLLEFIGQLEEIGSIFRKNR
jgi:hypothetical protein